MYMTPPVYEQALNVGGSIVMSAGGGKCGSVVTAWNWLYGEIVVVCVP